MFKRLLWYMRSDIKLMTTSVWKDRIEKIDGFYFYSKKPFSKSYQWHGTLGLESTYPVLTSIQRTIKEGSKALVLSINGGMGHERVFIWKGSLKKAESEMLKMIKQIQTQY